MRLILFAVIYALSAMVARAQNSQYNITHYDIHLDVPSLSVPFISGYADISITASAAPSAPLYLRLVNSLSVDSVTIAGSPFAAWAQVHDTLSLAVQSMISPGIPLEARVHYGGVPGQAQAGFGGWAFSGASAYNLGVNLFDAPHGFGRAWFPAVEDFAEKATYDVHLTVDTGLVAVAGGNLQSLTANPDATHTFHWSLTDPVPTYLVSAAVSDYGVVRDTFLSETGDPVPVSLYFRPAQLNSVPAFFQNLEAAFHAFEARFGPYRWQRVGFVGIPFLGGAMEHATNIALPELIIPFGAQFEYLIAHELAHNWFGNLVTCTQAEDMWLNEGWATYFEWLFQEDVYGDGARKAYQANMLERVIREAHVDDSGYWALSPIPVPNHTYSTTVYRKGATVAHTLRHHIGDAAFVPAMRNYFSTFAFGNHTSQEFKERLENLTGDELDDFFNGWVHSAGFPHFSIDSFSVAPNLIGQFMVNVHLEQRLINKPGYINNVRLPLRFVFADQSFLDTVAVVSGGAAMVGYLLENEPVSVMLDPEAWVCDATLDEYRTLLGTGVASFQTHQWAELGVLTNPDSALVQVVHNWIAPDHTPGTPANIRLSDSRYWTIAGAWPAGFHTRASFFFNAKAAENGPDSTWLSQPEDSLVVLWRPNGGSAWQVAPAMLLSGGSSTDGEGRLRVDSLKLGDYALGQWEAGFVGAHEAMQPASLHLSVFPNPALHSATLKWDFPLKATIFVYGLNGQVVASQALPPGATQAQIATECMPAGIYSVVVQDAGAAMRATARLVVVR